MAVFGRLQRLRVLAAVISVSLMLANALRMGAACIAA
jgi:hypothetical protein